jgi:hypothetical protein
MPVRARRDDSTGGEIDRASWWNAAEPEVSDVRAARGVVGDQGHTPASVAARPPRSTARDDQPRRHARVWDLDKRVHRVFDLTGTPTAVAMTADGAVVWQPDGVINRGINNAPPTRRRHAQRTGDGPASARQPVVSPARSDPGGLFDSVK